MKKRLLFTVLGIVGIYLSIAFIPVTRKQEVETLTFTLSKDEFQKFVGHLEKANSVIVNSDIPSNKAQELAKGVNTELSTAMQLLMSKQVKPKEAKK